MLGIILGIPLLPGAKARRPQRLPVSSILTARSWPGGSCVASKTGAGRADLPRSPCGKRATDGEEESAGRLPVRQRRLPGDRQGQGRQACRPIGAGVVVFTGFFRGVHRAFEILYCIINVSMCACEESKSALQWVVHHFILKRTAASKPRKKECTPPPPLLAATQH